MRDSTCAGTEGMMIRKNFTLIVTAPKDDASGEIFISTKAPDLIGDRLFPEGMILERYMQNPIVMWLHDYDGRTASAGIPIAKTPYLRVEGNGIVAGAPQFLAGDPFAMRVKNAWDAGFLRTASVGFDDLESKPNELGGRDITKWELVEWSLVPIPMYSEA